MNIKCHSLFDNLSEQVLDMYALLKHYLKLSTKIFMIFEDHTFDQFV